MHNKPASPFAKKKISRPQTTVTKKIKAAGAVLLVFLLCIGILAAAGIIYERKYLDRVYPGVYLGNIAVEGLERQDLEKLIGSYRKKLETEGSTFFYKNKTIQLFPFTVSPDDPDLTYELYSINVSPTIEKLLSTGRTGHFVDDLKTKISLQRRSVKNTLSVNISDQNLSTALSDNFQDLEIPARDAKLAISNNLTINVSEESEGILPDYSNAMKSLQISLENMDDPEVALVSVRVSPSVKAGDLQSKKNEIQKLFEHRPVLILKSDDLKWEIARETYKDWINIKANTIFFEEEKLTQYITEHIAKEVETPVEEARFEIKDNRVSEFKPSSEGKGIDYNETIKKINIVFFDPGSSNEPFLIYTTKTKPKFTTEEVNNLGIKEIIGAGISNFKGSPVNRRHNIKIGADSLNGILISPDEEFSLVKSLGAIDASSDYLPELVIKGNRTIPEYGGGLCQIGTTLFRAALQSGLPITERRSHSYRVRYYEPAGTDCTIYSPHPDCRFKNDTGNYILIQTRITEKDDLVFEFWGTKDGRVSKQTEPVVYNIARPPATKYIETEDLEPGQKKCTESAHDGADTTFDYTVTYKDGTQNKQTFNSHYRPWQAVCLIGKEKSAEEKANNVSPDSSAAGSQNSETTPLTP